MCAKAHNMKDISENEIKNSDIKTEITKTEITKTEMTKTENTKTENTNSDYAKNKESFDNRFDEALNQLDDRVDEIEGLVEDKIEEAKGIYKYLNLKHLFTVKDNMMPYYEINKMMYDNTKVSGSTMCILILAIFIASIGLNTNSTAVIIGAMLISPLMGNIMAFGYSLAVEDLHLMIRAVIGFVIQVTISLITSTIYFAVTPITVTTSELLARTSPTIWDVAIAFCGGLAGMIGSTRKQKSNVIPGVAIATALMPPLCTAGYGIGTGQLRFFFGAGYLFIINALFIALTTALVTAALGVPRKKEKNQVKQKKLHRKIMLIIIIAVIPSVFAAGSAVKESIIENGITKFVETEIENDDVQVVKTKYDSKEKVITITIIGSYIDDKENKKLEEKLKNYNLDNYSLHVIQNTK